MSDFLKTSKYLTKNIPKQVHVILMPNIPKYTILSIESKMEQA